jgi:hypothetical protein
MANVFSKRLYVPLVPQVPVLKVPHFCVQTVSAEHFALAMLVQIVTQLLDPFDALMDLALKQKLHALPTMAAMEHLLIVALMEAARHSPLLPVIQPHAQLP